MVAHACHPATWEANGRQSDRLRLGWATQKNLVSKMRVEVQKRGKRGKEREEEEDEEEMGEGGGSNGSD